MCIVYTTGSEYLTSSCVYTSHSCYSHPFNARHQWKEPATRHSALRPRRLHQRTEPVAPRGGPRMKAMLWHAKPPFFAPLQNQPAITFRLGQLKVQWEWHSNWTDSHLVSISVALLKTWTHKKKREKEGVQRTHRELFSSKQASRWRRCSVIISTTAVWVCTKCHSGKRLLCCETGSLLLRLHYRCSVLLKAFGLQLEAQGFHLELEGNWVNICCFGICFYNNCPDQCEARQAFSGPLCHPLDFFWNHGWTFTVTAQTSTWNRRY